MASNATSSASHSPTQARRRKKSLPDPNGAEPTQASLPSPLSRAPPPRAQNPSPSRPSLPRITQPPPAAKGKLAKMHSWSQSEFDTAAPGTLKKQLVAAPQGASSLFRFFKKKRTDSQSGEETSEALQEVSESPSSSASSSPEVPLPQEPSKPSSLATKVSKQALEGAQEEQGAKTTSPRHLRKSSQKGEDSDVKSQTSATTWIHGPSTPLVAAELDAAPNSSPAKMASPKKYKHKKSRLALDESPPSSTDESPRPLSSNGTHDTSTEDVVSSPDAQNPEMGLLGTSSKKSESQSPSTL